jgi:hypothetical protein
MAKARSHKVRKVNSNKQRNLFIVAIILVSLGLIAFFMEYKDHKLSNARDFEHSQGIGHKDPRPFGPDFGCKHEESNYVCDIKIKNPSHATLEWSSILNGLDGASVSGNGSGTVMAESSTVVQLIVPEAFCANNPDGEGSVTILDSQRSTNQSQAEYNCHPDKDN